MAEKLSSSAPQGGGTGGLGGRLSRFHACSLDLCISVNGKCGALENRDGNCHVFANSRWEMLLKAIRQALGNAERV
jgi:hypothetical protein